MGTLPASGQPGDSQDNDFVAASIPSRVQFRVDDLQPPTEVYVQRNDVVVVQWCTSIANQSLQVNIRLLEPGNQGGAMQPDQSADAPQLSPQNFGNIVPLSLLFQSAGPYLVNTNTFPLAEGFLLSVSLVAGNQQPTRGQLFARVFIVRGASIAMNSGFPLVADYVTAVGPVGWPGGRVVSPTEGPGNVTTRTVGNPAAGLDWTFTVQNATRCRLHSMQATFTSAVAVANRQVQLEYFDVLAALPVYRGGANQNIVAASSVIVSATDGNPSTATLTNLVSIPLPNDSVLCNNVTGGSQNTVRTNTIGIQAADQWSNIALQIEEWLDF